MTLDALGNYNIIKRNNNMKRIYIALSLVLVALCFASVETGFISGKTDSFIAKLNVPTD